MMKSIGNLLVVVVSVFLTLVIVEGVYSLLKTKRDQTNLVYQGYVWVKSRVAPVPDELPWDPNTRTIFYSYSFEKLLPRFRDDGVALGNSYFYEVQSDRTAMNSEENGCKVQKANLAKDMTYLRAGLYDPFAPVTAFYDHDTRLSPDVSSFISRYGIRIIRHRTNEHGERITLPAISSTSKVIIAGDSVANGSMLQDTETLASGLQILDQDRQYVNLGIGGADASDIICALQRAAERYHAQIVELVYVYCENDFKDDKPFGNPLQVIEWLQDFVLSNNIEKTTIVYAPYIYNIIPNVTRFRGGYRGGRFDTHAAERHVLSEASVKAGFNFIDVGDLALAEAKQAGTQYAALQLFSDSVHWSPEGTRRLARMILPVQTTDRPAP